MYIIQSFRENSRRIRKNHIKKGIEGNRTREKKKEKKRLSRAGEREKEKILA